LQILNPKNEILLLLLVGFPSVLIQLILLFFWEKKNSSNFLEGVSSALPNEKKKETGVLTWRNVLQWLILPPQNTVSGRAEARRNVGPASNVNLRKQLLSLLRPSLR
jgi:hypothetical protein